jgi:peroxiredoxin
MAAAPAFAGVTVGQPVPDFSITTVEGQRVDISDLRGKRVLVFMWASW